jgi:hypothetical protein
MKEIIVIQIAALSLSVNAQNIMVRFNFALKDK